MKKKINLFIYLHWATQLTECLLKTKEPFTTVYFSPHSSYMLSVEIDFPYGKGKTKIKKNKKRQKKTSICYHPDDMQGKAPYFWETLICGMQKHIKYQNQHKCH